MRTSFLLQSALLATLVSGCASWMPVRSGGTFVYFDTSKDKIATNRKPADIRTSDAIPAKQRIIGLVEAVSLGPKEKEAEIKAKLYNELREQAAAMNATGITDIQTQWYDHDGPALHAIAKAYGP